MDEEQKRLLLTTAQAVLINRPGMFERFKKEMDTGQYFIRFSAAENANFQAIYYLNRNSVLHVIHPELAEKKTTDAAAELVKKWAHQQPAPYIPQALPPVLTSISQEKQQASQISQAPVRLVPATTETPKERRARWLDMFEAEEKREKRGALQRLADSEGVDRSNMSKDIQKARELRDKQKRAGAPFGSQLVRDGKRAN